MKKKALNLKKLALSKETILNMQTGLQTDQILGGASATQACITNPLVNFSCRQGCEEPLTQGCNTVFCPATRITGGC